MDVELTLDKAVTRIRQSELVKKQQDMLKHNFKMDTVSANVDGITVQAKSFQHKKEVQQINVQAKKTHSQMVRDSRQCTRCGKAPYHNIQQCPAKDVLCHQCNKKGTMPECAGLGRLVKGLLGRSASVALGLVARVETISLHSTESVKREFPKLFSGLGKLEGEYKIELKPGAKAFALSTPRRVPLPLLPKVKQELACMEDLGVISKVDQPTD
ncbi:hypothetical protein LDENG_00298780 [Lucifuga dentata]|nr:hypothetical protein LDENG_00298780 [Lucifuga dentata]